MCIRDQKVANTLRFLNLPAEIQQWLAEGKLTEGHAKILLEIDSPKKQLTIAKRILRQQLTVRDAKNVVDSSKDIKIKGHIRQLSQRKYKAWENNLESVLGTKVNIDDKKGKGRIIIEYYSEEELRDLVDRLSRLDDDL
jgi:ParB family chromosome partitioning protein